jgi:glyoxalase family protein
MNTAQLTFAQLTGIHHVSALSAHIERTHAFYTQVLGMRPVIITVNQDDPGMYHLVYGDGIGSPGSAMTIFDLPRALPERRGNNSITRTVFRVAGRASLDYWAARLEQAGIHHTGVTLQDGRQVLDFDDPEGTQLRLVDDGGIGAAFAWDASLVPAEYQIRGLGYTMITIPELAPTDRFLTEALGLRHDHTYPLAEMPQYPVRVYVIGEGGAHAEVHVIVRDDLRRGKYGAGGVHHVALRVPEGQQLADWGERLKAKGYRNSGIVDRHYFMSIYVRDPNGVLFELATDGPGFDSSGSLEGEQLRLPPFLEPRRAEIEAGLKPLLVQSR